MSTQPMALLTGCPGWLGNRLLHFLLAGVHPDYPDSRSFPTFGKVRCLVQPGASTERIGKLSPDIETVIGDIRDPGALERLLAGAEGATVFHLAGIIHPRRISELYEINHVGTKNLVEAAVNAGVSRFVATSSNSPAGVSKNPRHLFDESSPYRPYLAYGRSKWLMEQELATAHAGGLVETVVLRPCWFYGPEQPPRQTLFFRMIKEGKAPIVGSGSCRRSMSYVDNTALGLLLAAAVPEAAGETYWIADRRPYTLNEIVGTVEQVLVDDFGIEVDGGRMRLPSFASEVAYLADTLIQRTGFYQQKIHVLSEMNKTIACSIEKARMQLGYNPSIELREGMRRSIEWCLAQGETI